MNTRKTIVTFPAAFGGTRHCRAWQPVKQNGEDAKRPARPDASRQLITYPDGSYRYYRNGVLRRERVSGELLDAEYGAAKERADAHWEAVDSVTGA